MRPPCLCRTARRDDGIPTAHGLAEAELENHLASFLSDLAHTFGGLDLAAGAGSRALRDGTAIQRTIAERHGTQRARLGWSEAEVRREYQLLAEELAAAVRRRVHPERTGEVEEVIDTLREFLAQAERISLASFRRAGVEQGSAEAGLGSLQQP